MATHSSILAWKIPWTEEAGGLQSMGLQRVGHDRANEHTYTCCSWFKILPWLTTALSTTSWPTHWVLQHHAGTFPSRTLPTVLLKDPDAGKDWRQEEKEATEDERLDGSTDSMDMSLRKLLEIVKDRETWRTTVHGVSRIQIRPTD